MSFLRLPAVWEHWWLSVWPVVWLPQYVPVPWNSHPQLLAWRSYSIGIPNLKFIGLPVLKIWQIFGHKQPGDFDLWPFHLRTGAACQHGTDDLPVNFGVSVTFHCQAMDQHSSDWWYDLTTFIFDVTAHSGDARHCTTSLYQVWRSLVSPYGRYGTFSVSVLISPETLTFDRSLNGVTGQLGHELHSC